MMSRGLTPKLMKNELLGILRWQRQFVMRAAYSGDFRDVGIESSRGRASRIAYRGDSLARTVTPNTWIPGEVIDASDAGTGGTFYAPSTQTGMGDKVGRIIHRPAGASATDCPVAGTWGNNARGCTRMTIAYGTSTASGDVVGQVKQITADVWDPKTSQVKNLDLADYEYDSVSKQLVSVTDKTTNLTTRYAWYGSSTRLAMISEPGLAPYRLWYGTGSASHKLIMVTRDTPNATSWPQTVQSNPPAGSVALARYHDDVPVDGNGTALPDVSTSTTSQWFQSRGPAQGYAVFGPDYSWDGNKEVSRPANGSNDWRYASIQYATTDGYTVNTATYGAGTWLLDGVCCMFR